MTTRDIERRRECSNATLYIATPASSAFAAAWPREFERLAAAFPRAVVRSLSAGQVPPPGATILALLIWGYHLDVGTWLTRLDDWQSTGMQVLNPVAALRWNTRKTYLTELAAAGLRVVPSIIIDRPCDADLAAARREFGVGALVVKPLVGACAHDVEVLRPGESAAFSRPVIVQPFMSSISSAGELSLIFFGGCFSHAVVKYPAPGDFRVQSEHGGSVTVIDPPCEALAVAHEILAAAPANLLYARVDLVLNCAGRFCLMELELIEPQLFLNFAPDAGAMLDAALRRLWPQADQADIR